MQPKPTQPGTPQREREGAAMLITMLVLLMATSAALVGIHSTSFEVRAAGSERQLMQAQSISENGIVGSMAYMDTLQDGPASLIEQIQRSPIVPSMMYYEPPIVTGKHAYRLFPSQMSGFPGGAAVDQDSVGQLQAFTPQVTVDITDFMQDNTTGAGTAVSGSSPGSDSLAFYRWTFTSRGRLQIRTAPGLGEVSIDARQYHEAASDARAEFLSGPCTGPRSH